MCLPKFKVALTATPHAWATVVISCAAFGLALAALALNLAR